MEPSISHPVLIVRETEIATKTHQARSHPPHGSVLSLGSMMFLVASLEIF